MSMKLELSASTRNWQKRQKKPGPRTHPKHDGSKSLAKQMRKLRRYYDRLALVAARLEGRPEPMPGVALKLKMAATMMQTGMTRRQVVDHLLRERAKKLGDQP